MKKFLKITLPVIAFLGLVYVIGPREKEINIKIENLQAPVGIDQIAAYVDSLESQQEHLKNNNEARVVWHAAEGQKTKFSIVYIHGFGASQMEGDPVHRQLADSLGCNLYLARLKGHGLDDDYAMQGLTAEALIQSAQEAVAIGKSLGDTVIIVATSTGATLALALASQMPEIKALVLYSPFVRLTVDRFGPFYKPWGKQFGKLVMGEVNKIERPSGGQKEYWSGQYHIDGYTALSNLQRSSMKSEIFAEVKQPVFMAYYYKNEQEQDDVVSVAGMLEMFDALGTPAHLKIKQAFPETGNHVIASSLRSADWEGVRDASLEFLKNIIHQ